MKAPFDDRDYPDTPERQTPPRTDLTGAGWRHSLQSFLNTFEGFATTEEKQIIARYLGTPATGFDNSVGDQAMDAIAAIEVRINEKLPAGRIGHFWRDGAFWISEADSPQEIKDRGRPGPRTQPATGPR